MIQYSYNSLILSTSTKPIEIFKGTAKIGIVKGFYKNPLMKFLDAIMDSTSIISYEMKDNLGNTRVISKDATGLGKKKVAVSYFDEEGNKYDILMKDMKVFDIGEQVSFEYKGENYIINKKPLKPAELSLNNKLIADWKIQPASRRVILNLIDYDFIDDQYLILGLFHAYFYADKNG